MEQQLGGKLPLTEHIWDISKQSSWKSNSSVYIAKSEKLFWFLTTLIAFVIAYIFSIMQTD